MKRVKSIRVAILSLVLIFALCSSGMASSLGVVRMPTTDGSVYIRSGGSMRYAPIGYANHGDMLRIFTEGRYWDKITMLSGVGRGKTGWMYNRYITNLRDISEFSDWGALAHIKTTYADSTVCLRRGPSTSYSVRAYLKRDDLLIVLDKYNSHWYEVQVVGDESLYGYVCSAYIANGAAGRVTGNVNLRTGRSTSSPVRLVIPSGSTVTVLVVYNKWAKVRYAGKTGYVWSGYLRFK